MSSESTEVPKTAISKLHHYIMHYIYSTQIKNQVLTIPDKNRRTVEVKFECLIRRSFFYKKVSPYKGIQDCSVVQIYLMTISFML